MVKDLRELANVNRVNAINAKTCLKNPNSPSQLLWILAAANKASEMVKNNDDSNEKIGETNENGGINGKKS